MKTTLKVGGSTSPPALRSVKVRKSLKESISHEISPYRDLSDEQLRERIAQLEKELGLSASEPAVLPPADSDSETKPN